MLPSAPLRSGTRQNSRALGTSNITPYISVSGQLNCRYSVPSSSCAFRFAVGGGGAGEARGAGGEG